MALVSLISTMNVDWPRTRLSDAPTRVNRRSTTPIRARRHGTNEPICASTTQRPTWRSSVDLPAMLGPVSRMTRPASSSVTSLGMNASRAIMRSTTGWRLPSSASVKSSVMSGRAYRSRSATSASAAQTSRGCLHPRNRVGDPVPELIEDRRFARGNALFGAKHLRLVLFQLGRDVALRSGERLAPLVVGRDAVAMGVGDFDVVAEDLVKAHLERRDAGPLPLARLQAGDVLLAAVARGFELVELMIVSCLDRITIVELRRGPLDQRPAQLVSEIGQQIELVRALVDRFGLFATVHAPQRTGHVGQSQNRIAQRTHFAWRRATERSSPRQALDI